VRAWRSTQPRTDPQRCGANRWRSPVAALALVLTTPGAILAQNSTIVPITQEPSHHLSFTNDWVRVFDVTAAPHATTMVHRHDHDYVFVTLGDANITSARTDGQTSRLVLKDGAIEYAPGGFAHSVANNLERPFHNITIELLHPSTGVTPCTQGCDRSPPCPTPGTCPTIVRQITADQWVADAVTLPPGAKWTAESPAAPRLLVVVSESDIQLAGEYESTAEMHRRPGSLIWMPVHTGRKMLPGGVVMQRMTPAMTNVGQTAARVVMVTWRGN